MVAEVLADLALDGLHWRQLLVTAVGRDRS
jgi:hypothetical protein